MYKTVSQSEAESYDTKSLIDFILTEFDKLHLKLDNFYVTGPYPKDGWKTRKKFLNGLNKKDFKNVHHLTISDSNNLIFLSFQNWSHNRLIEVNLNSIVLELMFDEQLMTYKELTSLGQRFYDFLNFEYGYIFTQSKQYSISEGKVKNGFISCSEKENPEYQKWSKYESATKFGFIRKVYELNFLSQKHLKNEDLNAVIKSLGQLEHHKNFSIWTLTKNEVEQASNQLSTSSFLVKNESFNDTKTCRLIDKEIKQC